MFRQKLDTNAEALPDSLSKYLTKVGFYGLQIRIMAVTVTG